MYAPAHFQCPSFQRLMDKGRWELILLARAFTKDSLLTICKHPHPTPHFPTLIAPTPAGATGFLGSLVLEQLLRCVPGLKQVYVLARGKKGLTAQQRIDR